jgi:hypothetical protein
METSICMTGGWTCRSASTHKIAMVVVGCEMIMEQVGSSGRNLNRYLISRRRIRQRRRGFCSKHDRIIFQSEPLNSGTEIDPDVACPYHRTFYSFQNDFHHLHWPAPEFVGEIVEMTP